MTWSTRQIELNGELRSIPQWRDKLGIKNVSSWCIYQRMFIYNWPPEKAFVDKKIGRGPTDPKLLLDKRIKTERINEGIESVQLMMLARGYFRKENRIRVYKMLNTWYKEFRSENMKAA